jgi:hypothetical protein
MRVLVVLRQLLRPGPRISREAAVEAAAEACREHGGSAKEPIFVSERRHVLVVHPQADCCPGGPWIHVDAHTGRVVKYVQGSR